MSKRKRPYGPRTLKSQFSELERDDSLSALIVDDIEEWGKLKHGSEGSKEIELLNSIVPEACPFCGSPHIVRDGHQGNGVRRFRCKACGRRSSPLTGTVLDSHKIPFSEWVEFCIHIFQFQSLSVSSIDNRNAYSTGRYWLAKIFACLRGYQDQTVLEGTVFIDETYVPAMPRDMATKDGKRLRGLSRNELCVATATDGDTAFLKYIGNGKPSAGRICSGMAAHIRHGSTIVDDGEKTHSSLCAMLGSERVSHPASLSKGLPDSRNPLDPVNRVHRLFKKFIRRHGGYDRKHIQDWCNLFSFIYNHDGRLPEMVYDMMLLVINHRERIKYRDLFSKKAKKS